MDKDNELLNIPPQIPMSTDEGSASKCSMGTPREDLPDLSATVSPWDVLSTDPTRVLQQPLVPDRLNQGAAGVIPADDRQTKCNTHVGQEFSNGEWFLGGTDMIVPDDKSGKTDTNKEMMSVMYHYISDINGRHRTGTHLREKESPKGNSSGVYYQTRSSDLSPSEDCSTHSSVDTPSTDVPCRVEGCCYTGFPHYMGLCPMHFQRTTQGHSRKDEFFMYRPDERFAWSSESSRGDQQHALYREIHKKAPSSSRNISFGEGVPGQPYNPNYLESAKVSKGYHRQGYQRPNMNMHTAKRHGNTGLNLKPGELHGGSPCRDRDCRKQGRRELNGFCKQHAEEIHKSFRQFAKPQPVPVDASTPMKPTQRSQQGMYPSTPDVDSRHRHRCITPRCNRWGQADLEEQCAQCYSSSYKDEGMSQRCDIDGGQDALTEEDHKDYEAMVGNIIKVSEEATRKCRRPGCNNFGNSAACWFCNECFRHSCSTKLSSGPQSLPCESCVKQSHDYSSQQSLNSTIPHTPISANNSPERNTQESSHGQVLRRLISEPRFRCKKAGCNNFGTVANQGYCNACLSS